MKVTGRKRHAWQKLISIPKGKMRTLSIETTAKNTTVLEENHPELRKESVSKSKALHLY